MVQVTYNNGSVKVGGVSDLVLTTFKVLGLVGWVYWLIFAIISPVTMWDSNTYNLARLELELRGGLFHNLLVNDNRQVFMTWTFDAIHLPFRLIKFGEGMPSFACLTGIILTIYAVVKKEYNNVTAWISVCGLLAMPCLMFQATSTKPDLSVTFCFVIWFYALYCYTISHREKYIYMIALSLGFAAGAKATGLLLVPLLGLVALIYIRKNLEHVRMLVLSCIIAFVLWGSIEIYINNYREYGHLMSPPGGIDRNAAGIRGAIASFIREVFENTSLGFDSYINRPNAITFFWEKSCRTILAQLGLNNVGLTLDPNLSISDSSMHFLKTSSESCSDYGPVGGLAIWFALVTVPLGLLRKKISVVLMVSLFGLAYLLLFCLFVPWGLWGNRYLTATFIPLSIALIVHVEAGSVVWSKYLLRSIILVCVVITPITSFNRNPCDIVAIVKDRQIFQLRENIRMVPVLKDIATLGSGNKNVKVALVAQFDSWVLPFFDIKGIQIVPLGHTQVTLKSLKERGIRYILILDGQVSTDVMKGCRLLRLYPGNGGFWNRSSNLLEII